MHAASYGIQTNYTSQTPWARFGLHRQFSVDELPFDKVLERWPEMPADTQAALQALLVPTGRVLKYQHFPNNSLSTHQVTLGLPGKNGFHHQNITVVHTPTSHGTVTGSGKTFSDAVQSLITRANEGTLSD